ncbi:putative receptor-like protein kinase [Senna tora]|uniref:Putative receptor-like protein kinase n=1 Tax=Senna tora TaxID=362788 RepID=A0A834W4S4_9FABA|nr:putative receptor-like protein kinase [Senna tora]
MEPPRDSALETIAAKGQKIFSYETLVLATENFSDFIGSGGFGSVYKGRLEDGMEIAVKKLHNVSPRGRIEFLKEAEELISGKRNSEFIPPPLSQGEKMMQSACLIGHTNLHRRGRSLELLDPAIAALTVEDTEQVINCIEIALLCVQDQESWVIMIIGMAMADFLIGVIKKQYKAKGINQKKQVIISSKILYDDMVVDEHHSQHGSSNSNQSIRRPTWYSDTFLPNMKVVSLNLLSSVCGGVSQNESDESEAQAPKGAETAIIREWMR